MDGEHRAARTADHILRHAAHDGMDEARPPVRGQDDQVAPKPLGDLEDFIEGDRLGQDRARPTVRRPSTPAFSTLPDGLPISCPCRHPRTPRPPRPPLGRRQGVLDRLAEGVHRLLRDALDRLPDRLAELLGAATAIGMTTYAYARRATFSRERTQQCNP